MIVTVFGYRNLISIDFTILYLQFLLNTQDGVWPHIQTPRSSSKILRRASQRNSPLGVWNVVKLCVCPVIDHEFRHNIVKVAVDPRDDSRVDPQKNTY